jgi:sugar lactone lactonase YvrE
MRRTSQVALGGLVAALVGLAMASAAPASAQPSPNPTVETVALFDAGALETPENIAIDNHNNKYISLALTGEIRKIAPDGTQSSFATLPLGAPPLTVCGPFFAGLTGVTLDEHDNLYANLASCDSDSRGIWKISPGGRPTRIAALPLDSLPNGLVHDAGYLYAADSTLGLIWRVSDQGGTPQVWARGDELAQVPGGLPGPNGLKQFGGEMYVSNPSQSTIVAIQIAPDGSAGAFRVHATGLFCDDFAFDVRGNLYCGTDPFNTLVRVRPDGSAQTILTSLDGLDGPTAAAFGHQGDRFELYLTNAAFPFLPGPTPRRPSLLRVSLDIPGLLHP